MKNRFPPDLQVAIFGPVFAIFVALVVGSIVYHAAQWGWDPAAVSVVALVFAVVLAAFFLRRRRRGPRDL